MRPVSPFAACRNKRGGGRHLVTASGCRYSYYGDLRNVGKDGSVWSSAPHSASSVYGSNLGFDSSLVGPEIGNYRSGGCPVRCVQLCISREQRPFTDFAEARQSGASNGGVMDKRGRGKQSGDCFFAGHSRRGCFLGEPPLAAEEQFFLPSPPFVILSERGATHCGKKRGYKTSRAAHFIRSPAKKKQQPTPIAYRHGGPSDHKQRA